MLFYVAALLLALIAYRCSSILKSYFKWRQLQVIPGPDCSFLLGQFLTIRNEPFMAPHKIWLKDIVGYDAPLMRYNSILGRNMLMIFDPAIVKQILTAPAGKKDDCRFYKPTFFFPSIIGKGLIFLEGEEWVKHRRLVQPAFSSSFVKQALDISVAPKVETFIRLWIRAGPKQEIDLLTHLSALTLDIIGDVGFSHDTRGLKDMEEWAQAASDTSPEDGTIKSPELSDPLINSMNAMLKPDLARLAMYLTGFGWLDPLVNHRTRRTRTALNASVEGIMANARRLNQAACAETKSASSNSKSYSNNKQRRSLLQLLMSANDSTDASKTALTDTELKDELKTFLLAGHETTSTWCYWAMFAMCKYPDVQEKLYQNVMREAPNSSDKSVTISLEQAERMEYLSAFLQECLRLFPPVGMTMRLNRYEETFAGYKIPSGTYLVIPVHLMHRHPKYWGDDANDFKPERWMAPTDNNNNSGGSGSGIDTKGFTFLPFGAGGRSCIGYRFATIEARLIMAHIIRSLRVEMAPSQRGVEHTFTSMLTMKAKPGLKIIVKER